MEHAELAVLAYADLDEAGLHAELALVEASIACLGEIVMPTDAAALHRAAALGAFVQSDEVGALAAYRAARRLQPQFRLPTSLAPPGGPISDLYSNAEVWAEPEPYTLPDTPEGTVYVDGVQGLEAPRDLPALVQVVRPDGSMRWSRVIRGPEALPEWFVARERPLEIPTPAILPPDRSPDGSPDKPLPEPVSPNHTKAGLWIGTSAAALGAAGLLSGAALSRTSYDRTPTASGRQLTNSLFLGSVGLGTAAASLGLAAAVVPGGAR
ncbi:MAG TPA: hypothetical protein ENK18_13625 [Deltaproteobacteria bacterium]|nr:hypothetical protein [Deltaproteobacteria bacterium]